MKDIKKIGLYDPTYEHDACGVGIVANIDNIPSHEIVKYGINVLIRLHHRGAVGGDENTGDGAGIMLQIPYDFFAKEFSEKNILLPGKEKYAVGMAFLPQNLEKQNALINFINGTLRENYFNIISWRDVPTNSDCLGNLAKTSQPSIKQFFISPKDESIEGDNLERELYILRRKIENSIKKDEVNSEFYICSLSTRTIIYKGLFIARQLPLFYEDLVDESVKSSFVISHQRYSTNTFPTWQLAHPFRCLAHNGEINTLRGNINKIRWREKSLESRLYGEKISTLFPIIQKDQSDSASMDNVLEFILRGGRSITHSMMMLVPQAWAVDFSIGADLRSFYDFHSGLIEPWDGPAAIAFSDGLGVGAMLDKNGLRPLRYTITKNNLIVLASETGVLDIPEDQVKVKNRLGPGQMIYIDLPNKRIQFDDEIKNSVARRQPYRRWLNENRISVHGFFDSVKPPVFKDEDLIRNMNIFGYTREEIGMIIKVMAETAHEPSGSMGNDASLAVLSNKSQLLFNYFKQLFAQVTNPPIDPIREKLVMSLMTFIGNATNFMDEKPHFAKQIKLKHPILTDEDLERVMTYSVDSFKSRRIPIFFSNNQNDKDALKNAIKQVLLEVDTAVHNNVNVIILSDKNPPEGKVPIPSLLAVAAVNTYLVSIGSRIASGIIIETAEAREVMHFALLLGYGATAINPYLALSCVVYLTNKKFIENLPPSKAMENYIAASCEGLLKIISKMGISDLRSYRGAQVFEAIGIDESIINEYFPGTASRIGGIRIDDIQKEAMNRYNEAVANKQNSKNIIEYGGNYHYRVNGENHLWTPLTITNFQYAVRNNSLEDYKKYSEFINNQEKHLCTLRGLFTLKPQKESITIDTVESASNIVKRFVSGAMSFGSISKEAHEAIAIAMNRLGGKSNSGEGGEDPKRYQVLKEGEDLNSAIKQVASARFGVTAEYLANAKEIQIKIAQGAKPGEGGQLPGFKVDETIAKLRHSTAGVTLISPPPHHDIYSIEDLSQLIYDLRNSNPSARISVKLVSEVGVGTIAVGVAKAHSDLVLISGHDGGTGASPLSSIKHAEIPWEIGLAETQQTLLLNNLRNKIKVQVDGQLKTGRDVVIAALLGADEFGFATTILVSLGCVMMRKCHSNTCPVGVATQDPELRKFFTGKPEHIQNFLLFVAEEVRSYLAYLGYEKLDDIIGRTDLLEFNEAIALWKSKNLDFSKIFTSENLNKVDIKYTPKKLNQIKDAFDYKIIEDAKDSIETGKKINLSYKINNTNRAVGTMLSYHIAKQYSRKGLEDDTIKIDFTGSAGQSFGAFLSRGVTFTLNGEANDYVAKGLSGGKIIIKPSIEATFASHENTIAGNVILYGATSGEVYINGVVGERFAIRNSGAIAVAESVGVHCCEYMTNGKVIVLGKTGVNFAAGMSGGIAYVYDEDGLFDSRCNLDMVDLESLSIEEDINELKLLIINHYNYTSSARAKFILDNWKNCLPKFVKVFPMEYRKALGMMLKEDAAVKRIQMNY